MTFSQFSTGQQAATTVAAALNSGTATAFSAAVKITNLSSSTISVFLGGSGVTTSTGDELPAGQSVILPIANIASVYVVAASNSAATVSWFGIL